MDELSFLRQRCDNVERQWGRCLSEISTLKRELAEARECLRDAMGNNSEIMVGEATWGKWKQVAHFSEPDYAKEAGEVEHGHNCRNNACPHYDKHAEEHCGAVDVDAMTNAKCPAMKRRTEQEAGEVGK